MVDALDVGQVRCFHHVKTQVFLIGFVFLCIPGAFNSMIGLSTGIPSQYTDLGFGLLYFIFALVSLLAPALVNKFGPRTMMSVGGIVYGMFTLSLLLGGAVEVIPLPLVTVCAALVGVGAGVMWTAQATMLLSYTTEDNKAAYISTFWVVFNLGSVVGGIQAFITNLKGVESDNAKASPSTFLVYIVMNVTGVAAVWMLQPLESIIREDGTQCKKADNMKNIAQELREMMKMMCYAPVMALLPLFLYSNWFYSFQLGVFGKNTLKPAASALAGALYWGAQMVGAKNLGCLLDSSMPAGRRAHVSMIVSAVLIAVGWTWGITANSKYHLDDDLVEDGGKRELFEYNDPEFLEAALLMTLWGYCDALIQTWCYWVMTQLYNTTEDFGRIAGIFKFAQSAGSAISFLLSYAHPTATAQLWINIVLFLVSLPGGCYLCSHIAKLPSEEKQPINQ